MKKYILIVDEDAVESYDQEHKARESAERFVLSGSASKVIVAEVLFTAERGVKFVDTRPRTEAGWPAPRA